MYNLLWKIEAWLEHWLRAKRCSFPHSLHQFGNWSLVCVLCVCACYSKFTTVLPKNILFITIIIFNNVGKLQPRVNLSTNIMAHDVMSSSSFAVGFFSILCWSFIFQAIFTKRRFHGKFITFYSEMTPKTTKNMLKWKMKMIIKSKLPVPELIANAKSCTVSVDCMRFDSGNKWI